MTTVFRPDTSFPYLAFARQHGLDYGEVLRASDTLEKSSSFLRPPCVLALGMNGFRLIDLIVAERNRRAKVAP
jgi:hypothetical protein